eukprot:COSAG01_NODE_6448_length_3661_cov_5.199607_1_plen_54_part_00
MRDVLAPQVATSEDLVDALIRESLKRTGRVRLPHCLAGIRARPWCSPKPHTAF